MANVARSHSDAAISTMGGPGVRGLLAKASQSSTSLTPAISKPMSEST